MVLIKVSDVVVVVITVREISVKKGLMNLFDLMMQNVMLQCYACDKVKE